MDLVNQLRRQIGGIHALEALSDVRFLALNVKARQQLSDHSGVYRFYRIPRKQRADIIVVDSHDICEVIFFFKLQQHIGCLDDPGVQVLLDRIEGNDNVAGKLLRMLAGIAQDSEENRIPVLHIACATPEHVVPGQEIVLYLLGKFHLQKPLLQFIRITGVRLQCPVALQSDRIGVSVEKKRFSVRRLLSEQDRKDISSM